MPIIVDGSQFLIMSVMVQTKLEKGKVNEDMVRHVFLNSIRQNRAKFTKDYGEIVIVVDSRDHWRKDIFSHYKANRKKSRDASSLDWKEIFRIFNQILDEMQEVFPYKIIKVPKCEGDDIIATICKSFPHEKKLILASDKDFIQLHKYPNVEQYDPIKKKWVKEKDPDLFLREHIIRGDSGDGVPNILSADDVLITDGKRQTPIKQTQIDTWLQLSEDDFVRQLSEQEQMNYSRNKMMIDLRFIPKDINDAILKEFSKEPKGHRSKIMSYLIKKKMKLMMEHLRDF